MLILIFICILLTIFISLNQTRFLIIRPRLFIISFQKFYFCYTREQNKHEGGVGVKFDQPYNYLTAVGFLNRNHPHNLQLIKFLTILSVSRSHKLSENFSPLAIQLEAPLLIILKRDMWTELPSIYPSVNQSIHPSIHPSSINK